MLSVACGGPAAAVAGHAYREVAVIAVAADALANTLRELRAADIANASAASGTTEDGAPAADSASSTRN